MEATPPMRGPCSQQRITWTSPVEWCVRASSSSIVARVTTESHGATGLLLPSFSRNGATGATCPRERDADLRLLHCHARQAEDL
jgi:hypothetical protein